SLQLLALLADGDGLYRQAVVVVVLRRLLVLLDGLVGLTIAGQGVGVLQPDARVIRVLLQVPLEKRHGPGVLLLRQECRAAFSLFSHAADSIRCPSRCPLVVVRWSLSGFVVRCPLVV